MILDVNAVSVMYHGRKMTIRWVSMLRLSTSMGYPAMRI